MKETSSVTGSQKSHLGEEYTFVRKSVIAVFVLESAGQPSG